MAARVSKTRSLHQRIEAYLVRRFGPELKVDAIRPMGGLTDLKGYGYGHPLKIIARRDGERFDLVLETVRPGPFGHEHLADRAQNMIWDHSAFNRLPKHVPSLDLGAFFKGGRLESLDGIEEFFIVMAFASGRGYNEDFDRLIKTGRLLSTDRRRVLVLADYLARIHRKQKRAPSLYRRRIRDLIGHGECIMGMTDGYPLPHGFITAELLEEIERLANAWRWRLRDRTNRLSQVHGDFHPWNVLFRKGTDFTVLDRARGEWGEPADDVTSMSINYLFFSLRRHGRLTGAFETLFRGFWDRYLEKSRDARILDTAPPFFAFRGLVIGSPIWYPKLGKPVRRKIFNFIQNVLREDRFDPARVNRLLEEV